MKSPQNAIAAISLDLDDTLWPSGPALEAAEARVHAWLEAHAPAVAAALPPPQFALFRRALAVELPQIAHDFTALRREALRRALEMHGEDSSLADTVLQVFLAARSEVELYPEVPAALARLSRRYRLVALTNGNADVQRAGVAHFFSAVVTAGSAGYAKPDPRIFHAACVAADAPPGQVLHVGDHPDSDIRGAARAGLQAAWINRPGLAWAGAAAPFREFADLLGLCDWLGV